jgi:hypothetical protein
MGIRKREVARLFHAYGAAVFEGQRLEHGLHLLIKLIAHDLALQGKPGTRLDIDSPTAFHKLGRILDTVHDFQHLTDAERKIIQTGLRKRNFLVHSYWQGNRVIDTVSPEGRAKVLAELEQLGEQCGRAAQLVESFIDQHLARAGTSLGELSRALATKWKNDAPVN